MNTPHRCQLLPDDQIRELLGEEPLEPAATMHARLRSEAKAEEVYYIVGLGNDGALAYVSSWEPVCYGIHQTVVDVPVIDYLQAAHYPGYPAGPLLESHLVPDDVYEHVRREVRELAEEQCGEPDYEDIDAQREHRWEVTP